MPHDPRSPARARWAVVGCALLLVLGVTGDAAPAADDDAGTYALVASLHVSDAPPVLAPLETGGLDPLTALAISAGLDEDWMETATTDDPVELCPGGSTLSVEVENLLNTPSMEGKWTCGSTG